MELNLNQKLSDGASDNGWKDKLKKPVKDARPQTEVSLLGQMIVVADKSLGCHGNKRPRLRGFRPQA